MAKKQIKPSKISEIINWVEKNDFKLIFFSFLSLILAILSKGIISHGSVDINPILNNGFWAFDSHIAATMLIGLGILHLILTIIGAEIFFLGREHRASNLELIGIKTKYLIGSAFCTVPVYMLYWVIVLISLMNSWAISIALGIVLLYVVNINIHNKIYEK